jgi:hypothetical protein
MLWVRGALLPWAAGSCLSHARGCAFGAEIHAELAPAPVWKLQWHRPGRCARFAVFCIGSFRERTVVQKSLDRFMNVPIRDRRELEVDDVGVRQPLLQST